MLWNNTSMCFDCCGDMIASFLTRMQSPFFFFQPSFIYSHLNDVLCSSMCGLFCHFAKVEYTAWQWIPNLNYLGINWYEHYIGESIKWRGFFNTNIIDVEKLKFSVRCTENFHLRNIRLRFLLYVFLCCSLCSYCCWPTWVIICLLLWRH